MPGDRSFYDPVSGNSAHGLPDEHVMRNLKRSELAGLSVGEKYHSSQFIRLVEHLGAASLRMLDSIDIHGKLPALGVASHFSLSWDGGNLGRAMFSKHESLLAISLSFVNAQTGQLDARCIGCPSSGQFHDGKSQAALVAETLNGLPYQIGTENLRRRLAACGGDGAITRGGPEARPSSTKSAEIFWSECKGACEPVTVWGLFHRSDIAQQAAAQKIPMLEELLSIAAECNRLFGVNAGKVILRGVAEHFNERALAVDQLSGTRKLASLSGAPAHLYRNYKLYHGSLLVRLEQTERNVGSQTKQGLTHLCRRLSDGTFIVFMLVYEACVMEMEMSKSPHQKNTISRKHTP